MAERAGFEPAIRFPIYGISNAAPSAARPPLPRACWTDLSIKQVGYAIPLPPGPGLQSNAPGIQYLTPLVWRRGWDLNPRSPCEDNGFRDRPNRPLSHLSSELVGRPLRSKVADMQYLTPQILSSAFSLKFLKNPCNNSRL